MKSAIVLPLLAAMMMSGCADDQVTVAKAHHHNHVSPPAVAAPDWPTDSFDQAEAGRLLVQAHEAHQRGDDGTARRRVENSLARWPVTLEAWETLIDICKAQQDVDCQNEAVFFHAKLLVLNGLPMHAATLGFETIAENPEGSKVDSMVYDRKTLDMAERLWVFCSQQDPVRNRQGEPTEPSFYETYPYAPVLVVIAVGAGLLTGINSLANK